VILFGEVTPTLVGAECEEIAVHADVVEAGKVFGVGPYPISVASRPPEGGGLYVHRAA
jgi:hypothetical protein